MKKKARKERGTTDEMCQGLFPLFPPPPQKKISLESGSQSCVRAIRLGFFPFSFYFFFIFSRK